MIPEPENSSRRKM